MPRHVNAADRLVLIRDAVIAITLESGFAAVTIRAVAQRIGTSTSAVTHYVESRDELLRSAVRQEIARQQAAAASAIAGLEGQAALRAFIEWAVVHRDEHSHRLWLALVLGAATDPVLRAELDRFNAWWLTQVQRQITDIGPPQPELAVDLLNILVDGLIVSAFDAGQPWPAGRRARLLDAIWAAIRL
jgi:AcrR family transcriptional regulator